MAEASNLSLLLRPDRLWNLLSLLFSGQREIVKFANHLHLMPVLRRSRALPPLPHMPPYLARTETTLQETSLVCAGE
jgi:hypothetical protein